MTSKFLVYILCTSLGLWHSFLIGLFLDIIYPLARSRVEKHRIRVCIAKRLDSETRSNSIVVQARRTSCCVLCVGATWCGRVDRGEEAVDQAAVFQKASPDSLARQQGGGGLVLSRNGPAFPNSQSTGIRVDAVCSHEAVFAIESIDRRRQFLRACFHLDSTPTRTFFRSFPSILYQPRSTSRRCLH